MMYCAMTAAEAPIMDTTKPRSNCAIVAFWDGGGGEEEEGARGREDRGRGERKEEMEEEMEEERKKERGTRRG